MTFNSLDELLAETSRLIDDPDMTDMQLLNIQLAGMAGMLSEIVGILRRNSLVDINMGEKPNEH